MLPRPELVSKNLKDFDSTLFDQEIKISGVALNANMVKPGDLFIALQGAKTHGLNFVAEAIANGAVAVLSDKSAEISIPIFNSKDAKRLVGKISAWFNEEPFSKLFAVGITGTNGKTTSVNLLNQIWQLSGRKTGVIGTIGTEINETKYSGVRTTPEASELQSIAALMIQEKVSNLAMEVSSHALVQERLSGAHFKIAGFTNLTQDHLDFHESMENYFEAKSRLFNDDLSDLSVINIDDPYGKKLFALNSHKSISVSRIDKSGDWHYQSIKANHNGFEVEIVNNKNQLITGNFPLLGEHNLDNLIMAVVIAAQSGLSPAEITAAIPKLKSVAGRLEQLNLGQNFNALVDYAHTPDAVERVLKSARAFTRGKIIAILGCGGDRDKGKRPLMGQALANYSDVAIFTSDNPRSESPQQILKEMVGELSVATPNKVIEDRKEAIKHAVSMAQSGDSILLLGKGHEVGQEVNGVNTPFSDLLELTDAIKKVVKN
jgi:UDP-N-acetylmuramoyl-L-alanyl-D-glutamate--2,6-diaminopimelate ligase